MRRKFVLIVLAILALGLFGTGLTTLYQQDEQNIMGRPLFTHKVSYGFPLGWYGYTQTIEEVIPFSPPPEVYWFSLGSFLLDAAFWVTISFFVCIAAVKSVNMLRRKRVSENLSVINI
jgi:hypothetical protein